MIRLYLLRGLQQARFWLVAAFCLLLGFYVSAYPTLFTQQISASPLIERAFNVCNPVFLVYFFPLGLVIVLSTNFQWMDNLYLSIRFPRPNREQKTLIALFCGNTFLLWLAMILSFFAALLRYPVSQRDPQAVLYVAISYLLILCYLELLTLFFYILCKISKALACIGTLLLPIVDYLMQLFFPSFPLSLLIFIPTVQGAPSITPFALMGFPVYWLIILAVGFLSFCADRKQDRFL